MTKKENRNAAGGKTLAKLPGYMALISARAHGKISKSAFKRKSAVLLAKLHRNAR